MVARLKSAGMVSVGRVNMTEFAFSGLGLNPHYGTPANPHSPDEPRIPGGSSSGSAVAVASGLVPVSIGTDTGGSVRIPAAFNGIVGFKATRGRHPMEGVYPLATSLDSLGVFARTVEDAVAVDAAMLGRVASPVVRGSVAGTVIVVPTNVVFDRAEPEIVAAFDAAIARLEAAGAVIRRQAIPAFDEILALYAEHGPLVTAEAYAHLMPSSTGRRLRIWTAGSSRGRASAPTSRCRATSPSSPRAAVSWRPSGGPSPARSSHFRPCPMSLRRSRRSKRTTTSSSRRTC